MNIIYTCDNNFVWIMGISMISLFENNKDSKDIHVYLLGDGISEDNRLSLSNIALKYQRSFTLISVPDLNIPEKLSSARWPKSAFTRMFAGELMPKEIDKVVYLDCDTIISASIKDLSLYPTDNYAICGVKDCVSRPYKDKIGIVKNGSYINAGVLLMNLNKLREYDLQKMIADFVDKYESAISYADQDILNGIFQGEFGILPVEYDMQSLFVQYDYEEIVRIRHPHRFYTKEEIEYGKEYPRIYHYTTCMLDIRPWFADSKLVNAWAFDKFMQMSPWKDKKKATKTFDGLANGILKLVDKMPKSLRLPILGLIHSTLRPNFFILKNNIYRLKRKMTGNKENAIGMN